MFSACWPSEPSHEASENSHSLTVFLVAMPWRFAIKVDGLAYLQTFEARDRERVKEFASTREQTTVSNKQLGEDKNTTAQRTTVCLIRKRFELHSVKFWTAFWCYCRGVPRRIESHHRVELFAEFDSKIISTTDR